MQKSLPHRRLYLVLLWSLAAFAGLRVGVNSLAFPMFGNIDEIQHVDVLLKYASGQLPSVEQDQYLPRSQWLRLYYRSPEWVPTAGLPPPPVTWTAEQRQLFLPDYLRQHSFHDQWDHNYEAMQPPTYYVAAGLWLQLGRWYGLGEGIAEIYLARLFGAILAMAMVLLSAPILRWVLPDASALMRFGVPALLACWPQDCFYFVSNDPAGAPMAALALVWGLRLHRRGGFGLGLLTGLAAAMTLLVKVSHLLVFVPLLVLLALRYREHWRQRRPWGRPSFWGALLGAGLPIGIWAQHALRVSGDLFGTLHKTGLCGFQAQTWAGVINHPIWSAQGMWTFFSNLHARFWFGEAFWAGEQMRQPWAEGVLLVSTLACLAASLHASLRRRPGALRGPWVPASWIYLLSGVAMTFALSLYWDFGSATYPSAAFPYVVSGRLLTVLMLPFAIVFVDGLAQLGRIHRWIPAVGLAVVLTTLLLAEALVMWPVLQSPFNFWNLRC